MKRFLKPKLLLPLVAVVLLAGAIFGSMVENFISVHAQGTAPITKTVTVNASQDLPGLDTGIDVASGSTLTLSASGQAAFGTGSTADCSTSETTIPDGQRITDNGTLCSPIMDPNAVLPSAPVGELIANIGSSGWFAVGSNFSATIHTSGQLFLLYNDVSGLYGNNSGSYTVTVTPTSHRQLFILLQGIDTSLDNGQIKSNTIPLFDKVKTAILASVPDAVFLNYSYKGPVSKKNSTPRQYDCTNTIENPLSADIQLLGIQIQAALTQDANTDIYLVGHSLGGVVAYGYLAALTETTGIVTPLPSSAHLRGVITLDSPIGGVSSDNTYFSAAVTYFEANCKGFRHKLPTAVLNLSHIFDSTSNSTPPDSSEPDPQGAQASILSIPFPNVTIPTPFPSNQKVAEDAQVKGTSVLTIGNDHDLLWHPSACFPQVQDFISTQWVEDEGDSSQIYARVFTSGDLSCFIGGLLSKANHFDVLSDSGALGAISTFLPNGATPGLTVAPPGPDVSGSL